MADSEKAIEEQLKRRKITKYKDVHELYLAERGLETMDDLGRFKNLQILWLNGNKLRRLKSFASNFQLTELYLQDNLLVELNGALKHLTCLEVLLLNGNQLMKLTDIVHELRAMQKLKALNLFGNPLSQEYDYRSYVIHHVPSVELLDRKEVKKEERDRARRKYEPGREFVKDTVAFGRCVAGPPGKVYQPPPSRTFESLQSEKEAEDVKGPVSESESRENQSDKGDPLDEAVKKRGLQRSVMQYSTFDWSAIPLSQERRLMGHPADQPRIVTVRFR